MATLLFPVVGSCRDRPGSVSSRWAWSKTPDLPLELSSYLSLCLQRCVFLVLGATLPFPFVGHYRNFLATLYSGSPWSKIPDLMLEFRRYILQFLWYNYFPFLVAISLFPLSFDVVVTCWHSARSPWPKTPGFAIGIVVISVKGDISTSGLNGYIVISGCPSMSHLSLSLAWSKTLFIALELQ